jgi:hypothetical protein
MNWPSRSPYTGEAIAIGIALIVILVGFAIWSVKFPYSFPMKSNSGFGKDWSCSYTTPNHPVCIKMN